MEHYPNSQPMNRRRWVGFDAFDAIMEEALSDSEAVTTELPAQPDNVIDLNANVVDFRPPDEAA